jgi:hypothetical protein
MFGLTNRFAARVGSIQRKVTVQARRQGGSSDRALSAKLTRARKQVARRGR